MGFSGGILREVCSTLEISMVEKLVVDLERYIHLKSRGNSMDRTRHPQDEQAGRKVCKGDFSHRLGFFFLLIFCGLGSHGIHHH